MHPTIYEYLVQAGQDDARRAGGRDCLLLEAGRARRASKRARAELRASGETMASTDNGGVQLTPQELQIALARVEGTDQRRGRPVSIPEHPDGRISPVPGLPQAGRRLPDRAHPPALLNRIKPRLMLAA